MQPTDFFAIGPLLLLAAACGAVMLQIALKRRHALTAMLTLSGLAAAMAALPWAVQWQSGAFTALLTIDPFALFFTGLILSASAATVLLALDYLKCLEGHCEEFYLLLLIATLGACVLASSSHFASFFIGLEILSIALYGLIAYPRHRMISVEAGLKYLVLAAAASAFLLFGIALIYAYGGSLDFTALAANRLAMHGIHRAPILLTGLAMVVVGVGFKLALVPFHMWTADVYQGAPAPATAFVATVSKGAMVALLVRLFAPLNVIETPALFWILAWIAFASMIGGNILALRQDSVKRVLAYSSIAHLGYLLTAFLPGGPPAILAAVLYIVAYMVTTMGAFGVICVLSSREADADRLSDFRGLFYRHPWAAGVFTIMLLSLAGIPLTAGFVAKFYVIATGAQAQLWWLIVTLIITSVVGLFYYLRIVVAIFSPPIEDATPPPAQAPISFPGALVLATMTVVLIWIGSSPEPLLRFIRTISG